ncbi:MAG: indole-3-glycerol phosphate synthase TrpC [bacterium]|nr:indole-3-glycerol phosphate synthase TrpC [bacterium]
MADDLLTRIARTKHDEIAALRRHGLHGERTDSPRPFAPALRGHSPVALIAEIKKASPSRGVIRANVDPAALASAYTRAGAHALSVLTDQHYFQGSWQTLLTARQHTHLPVLRKDFILDPLQIEETWRNGADALLLIVALLQQPQLADLHAHALARGLGVLLEVHDEYEMERALALNPTVIGINNRNLRDFSVTLETTERLARLAPPHITLVSESGIFTHADVLRVQRAGAHAILVGEALMRHDDVVAAIHDLLRTSSPPPSSA